MVDHLPSFPPPLSGRASEEVKGAIAASYSKTDYLFCAHPSTAFHNRCSPLLIASLLTPSPLHTAIDRRGTIATTNAPATISESVFFDRHPSLHRLYIHTRTHSITPSQHIHSIHITTPTLLTIHFHFHRRSLIHSHCQFVCADPSTSRRRHPRPDGTSLLTRTRSLSFGYTHLAGSYHIRG